MDDGDTVRTGGTGGTATGAKDAVTNSAASIVKVQVPVPQQASDQPVKMDGPSGVAVRVTMVPSMKLAEHPWPQAILGGHDATVPVPNPERATVSFWNTGPASGRASGEKKCASGS
jgi:hypothetical protein